MAIRSLYTTVACASLISSACALPNPNTDNTIPTVLDIVFSIAASVALLMVVINGFRYIIARGDPGQTASAKNGILYALVGLAVIMAAYSIVAFVVKGVI
ncbi:MAG TPA: hypothetical protein VMB52_01180 [Verrucomicrobiae bacterium]|nr:hypothetical protein [Verrucomicrobiae bacterium]